LVGQSFTPCRPFKRTKNGTNLIDSFKLDVRFYATTSGTEPVREWLKSLPTTDRKIIGQDIKTVQFGWPLDNTMVLLHGFVKKSQATPSEDLHTAVHRLQQLASAS
jgi:hypothetical protein